MSSHAYVLYLVAIKPYQSPLLNNYVLSNETFYSAVIIGIFIFSDATPELNIKRGAAMVLISSVFLLIFANFLMVIILLIKGRDKLKEEIRVAKMKRAEKELMEEEEEEERRQRQKREEEEFTRLPEDTSVMNHYDLNTPLDGQDQEFDPEEKPAKKKKGKKNKNKNNNDELVAYGGVDGTDHTTDFNNTTGVNETQDAMMGPGKKVKKDKKKKKDKNKNRQDDVQEVTMKGPTDDETGGGSSGDATNSNSDKAKKKKKEKKEKE